MSRAVNKSISLIILIVSAIFSTSLTVNAETYLPLQYERLNPAIEDEIGKACYGKVTSMGALYSVYFLDYFMMLRTDKNCEQHIYGKFCNTKIIETKTCNTIDEFMTSDAREIGNQIYFASRLERRSGSYENGNEMINILKNQVDDQRVVSTQTLAGNAVIIERKGRIHIYKSIGRFTDK